MEDIFSKDEKFMAICNEVYSQGMIEFTNLLYSLNPYSVECILENAFEIAIKQEFLTAIITGKINKQILELLVYEKNPLEILFAVWNMCNETFYDQLAENINSTECLIAAMKSPNKNVNLERRLIVIESNKRAD